MRADELSPWICRSDDKFIVLERTERKGQLVMTEKAY